MCYYYILVPTKYQLKYLFPEKIVIEICCQKCQECNTFCVTNFFHWISRDCQIKNIKYIQQNHRYYETIVHLLYHLPLRMLYKRKMVTLKNLILKYIGRKKNQYIEKKVSCWNKCTKCSVFRSDIETVWCMFNETYFHCPMNMFAPFWHIY